METSGYTTAGGIEVEVTASDVPETMLEEVVTTLGERRGGVLSSGMEYPGRYSRWHLAYVDPCLEIVARGRRISARALNARGRVVLPAVTSCLLAAGKPTGEPTADHVEVHVAESEDILPEELRSRRPTVFTAIREVVAAFAGEDEHLGLYGAFGYDLAFQFEPIRQVLTRAQDQRDLVLHLPDRVMVIDRKRETSKEFRYEFTVDGVSTRGLPREGESVPLPPVPTELPADPEKGTYAQVVASAKEKFVRGDLFEVVPGQVFHSSCTDPAAFYRTLRKVNPAPYEFLFNLGEDEHLVGASPEMYVRVNGDRVETCPISGTIARGSTPIEDAEAIRTLLSSVKEESELTMCTDVDRNDKSRICVPGSVQVIGRRQIEMYSRLIHTVDHIEGRLRPGFDALDAFLTHMWAVTVTGAPKTWAMQFIEDHEATTRRWYGGAVGYIGFDGSMNTGLTLRTAQIRGGVATVRAGATLLFDSDPEAEERETELKASALLGALAA
ncbi:anthranilate synthase component I, partial [Streptosporangium algeriense]